jgi:hypothetical protein
VVLVAVILGFGHGWLLCLVSVQVALLMMDFCRVSETPGSGFEFVPNCEPLHLTMQSGTFADTAKVMRKRCEEHGAGDEEAQVGRRRVSAFTQSGSSRKSLGHVTKVGWRRCSELCGCFLKIR